MGEKQLSVHQVTLSTGKVVLLKEPKIKHQTLAQKAIGKKAGDDQMLYASLLQQELLKLLIHSIDGKTVDNVELEKSDFFDNYFKYSEYNQLAKVLQSLMGDEASGEPQVEMRIV